MTPQSYPIVAVVQTPSYLYSIVTSTDSCLNGLSIIGSPTLGLIVNEHTIIV